MSSSTRKVLNQLIAEHGVDLVEDRRRTKSFLMDLLVGRTRERFWLLAALDHGVVTKLRRYSDTQSRALLIESVARQFHDDSGLSIGTARWAVETWSMALGIDIGQDENIPAPDSGTSDQVVGNSQGNDVVRDLEEAVRSASAGDVIRISPGVYRNQIVVTSGVELVAAGPAGAVIWHADSTPAIVWKGGLGRLQGIVFRAGRRGKPALRVDGGEPTISNSRFEGVGEGVQVSGSAFSVLENCEFQTAGTALTCTDAAEARVTGGAFSGQRESAILVSGSSSLVMSKSNVAGGDGVGILFIDQASGTLSDNEISEMESGGLRLQNLSRVTSTRNRVTSTKSNGLWVTDSAYGEFFEDVYDAHKGNGVEVTSTGAPRFTRVKTCKNDASGVRVHNDGVGVWLNCETRENHRFGVSVSRGANPNFINCRMVQNGDTGIYVFNGGRGDFQSNEASGNLKFGVVISERAAPELRDTTVSSNASCGLSVYAGGKGRFIGGAILGNGGSGVVMYGEGDVTVEATNISENGEYGVYVDSTARGSVKSCDIRDNAFGSVLSLPGAKTTMVGNRDH